MSSSDEARPWEMARPIRARPCEVFNHQNVEFYDVERAIRAINATPTQFEFVVLPITVLVPQVTGRGNLDVAYVASLSNEDAVRPVLLGRYPDGSVRLLDGYHRVTRLMQFRIQAVGAWMLTSAQTTAILLPPDRVAGLERV